MEPVPGELFRFPPPYSKQNLPRETAPHFMTSEGMLMPRNMQPPPMYGPRGATVPPKFLASYGKTNFQPRRSEFYCETCDRGFRSQTELEVHKNEHERCGIDGCAFIGHPLVVTKHIAQQHSSGLYDKLKNLNTPEDIAKWREERRKRYPSRANVELRQRIQEEKMKRGERLDERKSRFGQRNDRRKCYDQNSRSQNTRNERKRRKRDGNTNKDNIMSTEVVKDDDDSESDRKFMKFEGTCKLTDYSRPEKVVVNALTSLVGLYGSDDDESDEESNETQEAATKSIDCDRVLNEPIGTSKVGDNTSKASSESDAVSKNRLPVASLAQEEVKEAPSNSESNSTSDCDDQEDVPFQKAVENFRDIEEKPSPNRTNQNDPLQEANTAAYTSHPDSSDSENQQEEVAFEKVVETFPETEEQSLKDEPKPEASRKRIRKRQRPDESKLARKLKPTTSGLNYSKLYKRRQNTMLEKLLQSDIIHERNVLLQCVRYVVQKNFFGIGQKN